MQSSTQIEKDDKWETIKILKVIKEEIEEYNTKAGRFSNVPDFVTYAVRKELDRQKGGHRN